MRIKIIVDTIPHDKQRYCTAGDWFWEWEYHCPKCGHAFIDETRQPAPVRCCGLCSSSPTPEMEEIKLLRIKVSRLDNWRMEMCIAMHEATEALMCEGAMPPVGQRAVDEFDMLFETERKQGKHSDEAEPGDDREAPYYQQHQIATGIERILASCLGVDWNTYADKIEELP